MKPLIPDGSVIACRTAEANAKLRIMLADRWLSRLVGLLATASPPPADAGLLLLPGGSVHTFGLRYAIDVAHLDADLRVLGHRSAVRPGRVVRAPAGTQATLETAAGVLPADLTGHCFEIEQVAA